ncbi:MAG: hypothetical protein J7497_02210 [Chitinophagaceae bacterium]|nr:hypothetical protein [Chitinophagaceae bacterium]
MNVNQPLYFVAFLVICMLASPSVSRAQDKVAVPRLEMKITRYMINDSLIVDSVGYRYDAQGNLTDIVDVSRNIPRESFGYVDNVLSNIRTFDKTNKIISDFKDKTSSLEDNGNRVLISLNVQREKEVDSVEMSYIFEKNVIKEKTTLVNSGKFSSKLTHLLAYNKDGNVEEVQQICGNDTTLIARVLAWDNQNNPFYELSQYNFIFMQNDFPFNCQSLHNPTQYVDYEGKTVNVEITYNDQGYPLTYKRKGDSFIADEFVYSK